MSKKKKRRRTKKVKHQRNGQLSTNESIERI
jgi:hypothetical protein